MHSNTGTYPRNPSTHPTTTHPQHICTQTHASQRNAQLRTHTQNAFVQASNKNNHTHTWQSNINPCTRASHPRVRNQNTTQTPTHTFTTGFRHTSTHNALTHTHTHTQLTRAGDHSTPINIHTHPHTHTQTHTHARHRNTVTHTRHSHTHAQGIHRCTKPHKTHHVHPREVSAHTRTSTGNAFT